MERDIKELLTRGVSEIIGQKELEEKLRSGKPMRIKLGIDPTSPNLHLGRSIPLLKLRDFQKLGHTIVFIIGDFTGIIGDTSDKDAERPMLTKEIVDENKKTYFEQVGKIIDLSKAELHHNSEWLGKLTYTEIGEQADCFSVSDFIARDNIARRIEAGKRVSLREVLYPLMQGYDSVMVKADVELGGMDQKFNILSGRTLQQKYGQQPQSIILGPLIEGLDGRKMSSSWGNTIGVSTEPSDMYGKVMSMVDAQIITYFTLCTRVPMEEVEETRSKLESGELHPKDAKMKLAKEIVRFYHGEEAATKAEENFIKTFSEKGVPEDILSVEAKLDTPLVDILLSNKIVESKTEWRRLVEEGAVSNTLTGEKIEKNDEGLKDGITLKVGKRRFIKIEVL
ncbi:MAG: tyrosine--tRNA ligase [Minisyncoccia bacterium]